MFKLIKNNRPLQTYGNDINIVAKGLLRPILYADYLGKLPKTKTSKLYLVKEEKEMATNQTKNQPSNSELAAGKKREFKEVLSNYATPWKAEPGESIEGFYKGFDLIPGDRNEKFKSHRILPEGKELPWGVSGATIDTKMCRIPKGSYVRITYKGKTMKTNNGLAHDYTVETEKGVELMSEENTPDNDFT